MNTSKLISLIDEEILKLNQVLSKPNEELLFFDKVITENNFSNIKGLINLDCHNILVAYLTATSKKYNHEEIEKRLLLNKSFIENQDDEIINFMFNYLKKKKLGKRVSLEEEAIKTSLMMTKIIDYKSLRGLYENNDEELFDIIALIRIIVDIRDEYEINSQLLASKISNQSIRITRNQKNAFLEREIKNDYRIDRITATLSKISMYYQEIKSKDKSIKKDARKRLNDYTEVKKILESNKRIDIDKVLSLISSDKIKKEFLYQFNLSKKEEFNTLYKEYTKLSLDNKLELQALFNDYGIDYNSISPKVRNNVLSFSKEKLKELLDVIKELNIEEVNVVEFILENSNYETLSYINLLIKDNVITKDFIINNKEFLSNDNKYKNNYSKLLEIQELCKIEGINPRIFITDLSIYLSDLKDLKNNIKILKQYNLFFNLKSVDKFKLLKEKYLSQKIDILLELGYEYLLEESLELLNRDIKKLKKLYILKSIDLLPTDLESLIKVLDDDKFLAFDDDIDNYIFNIVSYKVDNNLINEVKKVELNNIEIKETSNSRVINIGGVVLSKNRIKRNRQILESFELTDEEKQLASVLIGSTLNEEEYDSIVKELKGKEKQICL